MDCPQALDTPNEEPFMDKLFIGRKELLAIIDDCVADMPQCHTIMFTGEGGFGKTAFLRRISREYKDTSNVVVVQLDYGHAGFQSLPALTYSFLTQLLEQQVITWDDLQAYREKQKIAERAFEDEKGDEVVHQLEDEAYLFIISKVNQMLLLSNRRLLVLSDTVEATTYQDVRINMLASEFKNAVIVVAGRPNPIVVNRFKEEYPSIFGPKGWNVHPVRTIGAFTPEEVSDYFAQMLPGPLKPAMIETIAFLTEGKPVLLALTVEWLKHNIQLPKEINKSKKELESLDDLELRQLRKYFERALVERVRAIRSPLDRAILYMSFLDRRYNKQILQLVLDNLLPEEVEALEPELQQMAFIRSFLGQSSGLLHDEAKRLINQHAWPPHDPSGEERRTLARKVINGFYLPEIKRLRSSVAIAIKATSGVQLSVYYPDERLAYELEMECLGYHYKISLDEGRRYATQLIQEEVSHSKREGIRQEIAKIDVPEAEITVARMNLARGQFEGNREILEQALEQENLPSWYRITLLRELSEIPPDPEGKAAYLRRAMEIAEQTRDQAEIARTCNSFGLMYRRQGMWIQAEESYKRTLDILKSIDDPDQKAGTLTNMAYAQLLKGELDLAESLVSIAMKIRESTGNQVGLALGYPVWGDIADAKGNRDQAVRAFRTAASLFEKLGREQDHARALIRLAEDKRRDRDFGAAEELLRPALNQPPAVRAWAERELGALYRAQGMQTEDPQEKKGKYKEAMAAFQQSLDTCRQKRDWYGQAQALYDLVFTSFVMSRRVNESYAEQLTAMIAEHGYLIIKAQLDEIYADVVYERGEIIPAFHQYVEVAKVLATRHVRKYEEMFERFKIKFLAQPGSTQKELCDYFDRVAAELAQGNRLHSALNNLCQAIRIAY